MSPAAFPAKLRTIFTQKISPNSEGSPLAQTLRGCLRMMPREGCDQESACSFKAGMMISTLEEGSTPWSRLWGRPEWLAF